VRVLRTLSLTIPGYAFPMQFWVQAAANRLSIVEHPVALIYNDLTRTFGSGLDDPSKRLAHYRAVFEREIFLQRAKLPEHVVANVAGGVGVNCHPVPTLLESVRTIDIRPSHTPAAAGSSSASPASTLLQ
jgi:hypothetical protein